MHRALVAALALTLGACSARLPQPQPLQHVSLKDDAAPQRNDVVSQFQGLRPITVAGAGSETNSAIALAMFHEINLARIPVNTPGANWTLTGNIAPGVAIIWVLRDEGGNARGEIKLSVPETINPAGLASASIAGLKPLLPRVASPSPRQEIRL